MKVMYVHVTTQKIHSGKVCLYLRHLHAQHLNSAVGKKYKRKTKINFHTGATQVPLLQTSATPWRQGPSKTCPK